MTGNWIWTDHDPDAHGQIAQFRLAFPATLIEEVVGLRPAEPGCRRVIWTPPSSCRLAFAEGRLDTPHGPVTVRWEAGGALRHDVPAGVQLEIQAGNKALTVCGPCKAAEACLVSGFTESQEPETLTPQGGRSRCSPNAGYTY